MSHKRFTISIPTTAVMSAYISANKAILNKGFLKKGEICLSFIFSLFFIDRLFDVVNYLFICIYREGICFDEYTLLLLLHYLLFTTILLNSAKI